MADHSGSSGRSTRFRALFEAALQDYEKATNITLASHPLATQLQSCQSAESITAILQGQVPAFCESQGSDRAMKSIEGIVSILTRLSATSFLGDAIDLPFPPVKAMHAGLTILLATAKDATATFDPLVDLLESIEHFLSRLDIYTRIPPTPVMDDVVVKIMMELLSTLALATNELKQGRASESVLTDMSPY